MPVLLRINHDREDIIFQILTEKPSSQSQLEVFLGGQTYLFSRKNNSWALDDQHISQVSNLSLFDAIAKALCLRFRISSGKHV